MWPLTLWTVSHWWFCGLWHNPNTSVVCGGIRWVEHATIHQRPKCTHKQTVFLSNAHRDEFRRCYLTRTERWPWYGLCRSRYCDIAVGFANIFWLLPFDCTLAKFIRQIYKRRDNLDGIHNYHDYFSHIVILCEYSCPDYFSHTMVRQRSTIVELWTSYYDLCISSWLLALLVREYGTHTTVPTVYLLFSSASFTSLLTFVLWPLTFIVLTLLATCYWWCHAHAA